MSTTRLLEGIEAKAPSYLDEMDDAEFIAELLEHAPEEILAEVFDAEDAQRLEVYAELLEDEGYGILTEESAELLEGLRSMIGKVKDKVKSKIPPGMKMVFGKLVKVGKAVGKGIAATAKGAVKAGKAVGKAGAAVGRTAVKAKRGAQARTYGFSKAGKEARALAKKVRDTHGREAAKNVKKAAKDAYQKASRAGETSSYAAKQAAAASKGASKKQKAAKYHDEPDDEKPKAKPKAKKGPAMRGARRPPPRGFAAKQAAKQAQ